MHSISKAEKTYSLKLYSLAILPPLSTILKILENMGLTTFEHIPSQLKDAGSKQVYVNEFIVQLNYETAFDATQISDNFKDVFINAISGECENDKLNTLVLVAGLSYQKIVILRAYCKYLNQINFRYSQQYIEATLAKHAKLTLGLTNLFSLRFDLTQTKAIQKKYDKASKAFQKQLDAITRFDEDFILRQLYALIQATLRTNVHQTDKLTLRTKPY